MCLAIPGRLVAIHDEGGVPVAEIEYGASRRRAQLVYLPEAQVGDWVLVQAGFVYRRLSEAEAREALGLLESVTVAPTGTATGREGPGTRDPSRREAGPL